jgi:hypothetical protein
MNSNFTVNDLRSKIAVSFKEALILLTISERSLYTHMQNGTGPIPCRRNPYAYRVAELERWMKAREDELPAS